MAVNVINELDVHNEMENEMTENLEGNEDSIAALLLKYSHENNNNNNDNNTNIKNNNDEDEETSGLSSLLSKFSLKKLRSQKWAKPVARFPLNFSVFLFWFSYFLYFYCCLLTNFTLSLAEPI